MTDTCSVQKAEKLVSPASITLLDYIPKEKQGKNEVIRKLEYRHRSKMFKSNPFGQPNGSVSIVFYYLFIESIRLHH